ETTTTPETPASTTTVETTVPEVPASTTTTGKILPKTGEKLGLWTSVLGVVFLAVAIVFYRQSKEA
ncbi:LPXTG cell wall anchor domain-containing protein, partial [Streptococcus suis]|nr:LPXTG cell wall anchor domain-containing protein [Streptococcus suis]